MSKLSQRDFTLINLMLGLEITVNAEWRDQAKQLAVDAANEQGYSTPDNHTVYWIPKRDYHDTSTYVKL